MGPVLKKGEGIGFQIKEGPCTAACKYCYERPVALKLLKNIKTKENYALLNNFDLAKVMAKKGFEFSLPEYKHYLGILKDAKIKQIFFLGSEPTENKAYDKMLALAKKYKTKVCVYTSGKMISKLENPIINQIILHLDYDSNNRTKNFQSNNYMKAINTLLDLHKKIDLRVNFSNKNLDEKYQIYDFYKKIKPHHRKNVLLKYSFTCKVAGNPKMRYVSPNSLKKLAPKLMKFVDEFKNKFPDAPMKSERPLFRCAFTEKQWVKYSSKGGFRSLCNMDFTIYSNKGLSFCPPARDLNQGKKIKSVNELKQKLVQLRAEFEEKAFQPSFKVCKNCQFRINRTCQGGCGGYKE